VRVLSRLFRRLFCAQLTAAHDAGRLQYRGHLAALEEPGAFARWLQPLRRREWVVYAKRFNRVRRRLLENVNSAQ
jgi:hypothetical protein